MHPFEYPIQLIHFGVKGPTFEVRFNRNRKAESSLGCAQLDFEGPGWYKSNRPVGRYESTVNALKTLV